MFCFPVIEVGEEIKNLVPNHHQIVPFFNALLLHIQTACADSVLALENTQCPHSLPFQSSAHILSVSVLPVPPHDQEVFIWFKQESLGIS